MVLNTTQIEKLHRDNLEYEQISSGVVLFLSLRLSLSPLSGTMRISLRTYVRRAAVFLFFLFSLSHNNNIPGDATQNERRAP